MIFKTKAKKNRELAEKKIESAISNIPNIIENYQNFEFENISVLGRAIDFNYPRTYIYMMGNYGADAAKLVEEKRYASLYSVFNSFMKCYAICYKLIETYSSGNEEVYRALLKSLYKDILLIRKRECLEFKEEYVTSYEDEIKFFRIRYTQIEGILKEFFPEYSINIDSDEDVENINITIEKISNEIETFDIDKAVYEAIVDNSIFDKQDKADCFRIWLSSKNAVDNGIQTTMTRILGAVDGGHGLMLNKNEGIDERVLSLIEKSMHEIISMVKREFNLN